MFGLKLIWARIKSELLSLESEVKTLKAEVRKLKMECADYAEQDRHAAALFENQCAALSKYRTALKRIRDEEGKVCDDFATCIHPACNSSYRSYAHADVALSL